MKITKGNVLDCKERPIIIPHVCNDCGGFGKGFALTVLKKYPEVVNSYKKWYKECVFDSYNGIDTSFLKEEEFDLEDITEPIFKLGQIQICKVNKGLFICNMLAQSTPGGETIYNKYLAPIRYQSLEECMLRVAKFCKFYREKFGRDMKIKCPWFGCGLAGGSKDIVGGMIKDIWEDFDVEIFEL